MDNELRESTITFSNYLMSHKQYDALISYKLTNDNRGLIILENVDIYEDTFPPTYDVDLKLNLPDVLEEQDSKLIEGLLKLIVSFKKIKRLPTK